MSKKPSNAPDFVIDKPAKNVTVIRMDVRGKDWSQRFLVRSDIHWDSDKCRRDVGRKMVASAVAGGAGIIDLGDEHDAMQGPGDKRACKEALRDELARADYFDGLVEEAVAEQEKYAWHLVGKTLGNHEESVIRHYGTNLTKRTCDMLRMKTGAPIHANGYQGWYVFAFRRGNRQARVTLYANHGYGGGGQVTKDLIQAHRMQSYVDADIIASGHTHDLYAIADTRLRVNERYLERQHVQWILKTGTLKQTYGCDGSGLGFEQRQGHRPKPVGACWVTMGWDHTADRPTVSAVTEAFPSE